MNEALRAKDKVGLLQLMGRGKVFMVTKGSSALVLDIGFTSMKVRINDGDMSGKAGWLPREYVSK